jgi:hypothetical protein
MGAWRDDKQKKIIVRAEFGIWLLDILAEYGYETAGTRNGQPGIEVLHDPDVEFKSLPD